MSEELRMKQEVHEAWAAKLVRRHGLPSPEECRRKWLEWIDKGKGDRNEFLCDSDFDGDLFRRSFSDPASS